MKVFAKRSRFTNIFLGCMILFLFGISLISAYLNEHMIELLVIGISMSILGLSIIVYEFHFPTNFIKEDERNIYIYKRSVEKKDIKYVYIKFFYKTKYLFIELFSSDEVIKIGSIKKFNDVFEYLRSIAYENIDNKNKIKNELIL